MIDEQRQLGVYFTVREDLPSERVNEYRDLVLRGLRSLQSDFDTTHEEHEMIDRIFCDHEVGFRYEAVRERRRLRNEIQRFVEERHSAQNHEHIKRLEDEVDALDKFITY